PLLTPPALWHTIFRSRFAGATARKQSAYDLMSTVISWRDYAVSVVILTGRRRQVWDGRGDCGDRRDQSCRNAIIGLTLVARRAGIQHASMATNASSSAIEPNVNGS